MKSNILAQHTVLISTRDHHLSIKASAWEILWITLKLAKVFSAERCLMMQLSGGVLSVLELQKIKIHIEHILFASMESGDYLMPDLTLSDTHPEEAFIRGDPRCHEYLDRATLHQLVGFIQDVRSQASARRLLWDIQRFQRDSNSPESKS